jgi:hypothetical protein
LHYAPGKPGCEKIIMVLLAIAADNFWNQTKTITLTTRFASHIQTLVNTNIGKYLTTKAVEAPNKSEGWHF